MKNYYVLSNGKLSRKDNTLFTENVAGLKRAIPIEDVHSLYLYGEIDINTKLLNFLAQKKVTLHVFNYYGFYSGSYYPREYLHSGYLLVQQVSHYSDAGKRLTLAKELVRASAHSILKNIAYYSNRKGRSALDKDPEGEVGVDIATSGIPTDPDLEATIDSVGIEAPPELPVEVADGFEVLMDFDEESDTLSQIRGTIVSLSKLIDEQKGVNELMGIEGKIRERYYAAWRHIISGGWAFEKRVRRPPDNEVNALISFGNSMLYTVCLSELYRTQLTPTISYLHQPGARRFSLALDLSEIFKPILVDRAIFRLLNTGQLKAEHFDRSLESCYLNEAGRKLFLQSFEERLVSTIHHRRLGRHVSYRHLIRLECYKLVRHLSDVEPYRAFRAWW